MTMSHIYLRSLPAEEKPHGSVDILNPPWNTASSAEQTVTPTHPGGNGEELVHVEF